ncbi:MAG: hypothetical protein EPO40_12650 [Myxococcaceae bacterium]|nr:MAG: hypothetical protein EPO40_12650 [Myxococcaceae bacterium]
MTLRALPLLASLALGCTPSSAPPIARAAPAPEPALPAAPVAPPPVAPSSTVAPMPSLGPVSGRPPSSVVVMLHGYGANGADLRDVAQTLARDLPDTVFLLPDAPEPMPGAPGARQWFALAGSDDSLRREGVRRAVTGLVPAVDRELQARALPRSRLAFVGFSQGAMLALDLGLHMTPPPAGVVSLSGRLVHDTAPSPSPAPALIVHGTSDARIPVSEAHHALSALARLHVRTESLILPGVGHTIAPQAMASAGSFLHRLWP